VIESSNTLPKRILFLNNNVCHKYGIFIWYYIISHSFLPTQLFNFCRHENLRVFLFLFKQFKNTIVCRVSSQKGVILPKLSLSI